MFKAILILAVFILTLVLSFLGGMYLFDGFSFIHMVVVFAISAVLSILATYGTISLMLIIQEKIQEKALTPPSELWNSL